jgi:hypothetical protein
VRQLSGFQLLVIAPPWPNPQKNARKEVRQNA